MKILFIGGTRFIGRAAAIQLHRAGHKIAVFHRGQTNHPLPDGIQHIHGELANLDDFKSQFREFAPDVVVHTLLMEQGEATQMLRVFRSIARRVVVISSIDVYRAWGRLLNTEPGEIEPMPLTETSPLREESYPYRNQMMNDDDWRYYYDKILVEKAAMRMPKPASTVLRLPMVYGEYDYQNRIVGYLQRMEDGRSHIFVDERQANWRAPRGYIENMAHAIALVVTDKRATNRIYHVAEPYTQAKTEIEWIRAIGEAAGWQGEIVPTAPEKLPRELRMNPRGQDITVDITRIQNELKYEPMISFEEGMQHTVTFTRAHVLPTMSAIDYTQENQLLQQ